ncbi:MAG: hypothetical protein ACLSF6_06060 [Evtepia gabavorous]
MKKVLQSVASYGSSRASSGCSLWPLYFWASVIGSRVVYLVLPLFWPAHIPAVAEEKAKGGADQQLRHSGHRPAEPVDAYIQVEMWCIERMGSRFLERSSIWLKRLQEAIQREQNSPFHRSSADQELIFRFSEKHGRQSNALTSQFESLDDAAYKSKDLQEKIKLLSEALEKYKAAKAWHYKISKGGMMYFQDMWERICWEDHEEDLLEGLLWERDEVPPRFGRRREWLLQKEIYSQFEPEEKSSVQRILRSMEAEGLISRTKKSGTYWVALA